MEESNDATTKNLMIHSSYENVYGINEDALIVLEEMSRKNSKYDMIYLDGGKENYHKYMKFIDKIIEKNGILIVDDIFFHGDSLNKHQSTEKGKGTKKFLEMMRKDKSYRKIILPISNGIMLLIKE
jgi:predicted O-methyltransferase YrrM